MTGYDQLNCNLAPSKSVFDSQRLTRPSVYRHCGRASLCIGSICLLAEISVFVIKRGLSSAGVGIWTGAPFVIFGAASLAVPRTRTVCSVNIGFGLGLACVLLSALGAAVSAWHIGELADILNRRTTPRPNFELSCPPCAYYIILKEVVQIGLLLLQLAVSATLACFAYSDCLCCLPTETEVILGRGEAGEAVAASSSIVAENQNASSPLPPPPPLPSQMQHQQYPPAGAPVSPNVARPSSSVSYVGQRQSSRSSTAAAAAHQLPGSSFGPPPMLYDL